MNRLLQILIAALVILIAIWSLRRAWESYSAIPEKIEEHKMPTSDFESWREFSSAIARFKVKLPKIPQHATEEVAIPNSTTKLKYEMYATEDDHGATFLVSLITYPDSVDVSQQAGILENVMNELVAANPQNKLQSMQLATFEENKALDFTISNPETIIVARAFLIGHRLYLLTMIDKLHVYNPKEYQYFLQSFQLIED